MAQTELRAYYVFALKAMAEITTIILLPALAALALKYLYADAPAAKTIFPISLVVAFVLSMAVVVKKIQSYGREYKKLTDTDSQATNDGSGAGS